MAKTFKLQVVAPDCPAVTEDAVSVTLPGEMGEFGVMAGHVPFLSTLKPGVMRVVKDGQRSVYFLAEGFAEVNGHSVIVLAEAYERAEEIDVEAAQKAIQKAGEKLSNQETIDDEAARQMLARAKARLKAVEEAKSLKK
jgi:F-type H+-transporting ATPase subunit epsilon